MPRHFEGNLAAKAANDAERDSDGKLKRSSGVLGKDEWKKLEDVSGDDGDSIVDVSDDASRYEDAQEGLNDLVSQKMKLPVPKYLQEKRKAIDEEMKALSRKDKLQTEREEQKRISDAQKLKNAVDLSGEATLELGDADLEIVDENEERRKMEKLQVGLAKKKTLKRIAEREANIEALKKSTEEWNAEKDAIEAQSAKRLKAIGIANRANAAAEAMAFEERAQPMREVARQFGREEGKKFLTESDHLLEMNAEGKVVGVKNFPMLDWNALRRGMAGRMEAIKNETFRILQGPHDDIDRKRLKQLEAESQQWMEMYRDGKMMEESGVNSKDIHLRNRFYRQVDVVIPEGMDKTDAETLTITPENELEVRLNRLNEQDRVIDGLIKEAGEALWNIDSSDIAKTAKERQALSDFVRGAEVYQRSRKEELGRNIEKLRELDRPENLDIKSVKANMLIQGLERYIGNLKNSLGRIDKKETVSAVNEEIERTESEIVRERESLDSWKNHPIREEALNARHLDLQDKIRETEMQIDRQDLIAINPTYEDVNVIHASAAEAMKAYRPLLTAARDQIHLLLRRKADIANERTAILEEKINREFEEHGLDIDLTDLNERVYGLDIPVDTSDFEEEPTTSKKKKKAA